MRAMICVASSKHRSMRLARMWNNRSPGVETAWRAPARISRNGCSSAGRGSPKRRVHASDPNPMTQESPPSRSRNSTARNSAASSPQNDRRAARLSDPGLTVTIRKIAARVSGAETACGTARTLPAASGAVIGLHSIGWHPEVCANFVHRAAPTSLPSLADERPCRLRLPPRPDAFGADLRCTAR